MQADHHRTAMAKTNVSESGEERKKRQGKTRKRKREGSET